MNKSKTPWGVKLISFIYLAFSVLIFIFWIQLLARFIGVNAGKTDYLGLSIISLAFFLFISIYHLSLAGLPLVVGIGLWRGKSWARITAIILPIFLIIGVIVPRVRDNLFTFVNFELGPPITNIAYSFAALWSLSAFYLIASKRGREFFVSSANVNNEP